MYHIKLKVFFNLNGEGSGAFKSKIEFQSIKGFLCGLSYIDSSIKQIKSFNSITIARNFYFSLELEEQNLGAC